MSVAPTLPFLNTDEPEAWEDHLPENGLWRPQKDWWGGVRRDDRAFNSQWAALLDCGIISEGK